MYKSTLALTLLLASGAALAEDQLFTALDADSDGAVTVEEAQVDAIVEENFAVIDADKNGAISEQELLAYVDSLPKANEEVN